MCRKFYSLWKKIPSTDLKINENRSFARDEQLLSYCACQGAPTQPANTAQPAITIVSRLAVIIQSISARAHSSNLNRLGIIYRLQYVYSGNRWSRSISWGKHSIIHNGSDTFIKLCVRGRLNTRFSWLLHCLIKSFIYVPNYSLIILLTRLIKITVRLKICDLGFVSNIGL